MIQPMRDRTWAWTIGLLALPVIAWPFIHYALDFGWRGLTDDLSEQTYLWTGGESLADPAIFGHMLIGAILTGLAPLQAIPALRRSWPGAHRAMGHVVLAAAILTALGGLVFIFIRGTVGGPIMDLGFGLYGGLVLVCAVMVLVHARARRIARHRRWALRLVILALASWIYRVHYLVWYLLTGGLASTPDFTGVFDRLTIFAFYLPYLLALELVMRRRGRRQQQRVGMRG